MNEPVLYLILLISCNNLETYFNIHPSNEHTQKSQYIIQIYNSYKKF